MIKVFLVDSSAVTRSIEKKIIKMTSKIELVGESSNLNDIYNIPFKSVDFIFIDASEKNIIELERILLQKRKVSATLILLAGKKIELLRNYNNVYIWEKPDFIACSSEKMEQYALTFEKKVIELKTRSFFNRKKTHDKKVINEKKHTLNNNNDVGDVKNHGYKIVLMGVSTGGPGTVLKLLNSIGKGFPLPILITQHIDSSFEKNLTQWLNNSVDLSVHVAKDGIEPKAGNVYFAPADNHMEIRLNEENKLVIRLNQDPPVNFLRPAVDKLFISGAETLNSNVISVLLTGMGADGAKGSCVLKEKGAYTIGESEETCVIFGMPKAAYDMGGITELIPLYKIADRLRTLVQ